MIQHFRQHAVLLKAPSETVERACKSLKRCAPGHVPYETTLEGLFEGRVPEALASVAAATTSSGGASREDTRMVGAGRVEF
jgi:hypothetical protein